MKAIQVSFILQNDKEHEVDTEHFITHVLAKLKADHDLKQVNYHACEYFEK